MTNCDSARPEDLARLSRELEVELLREYGPMLGGADLARALGYPSSRAFQQALLRRSVEVAVFAIEKRRGKFALTRDVAQWLASVRFGLNSSEKGMPQ
ncbi:MAG: hypothetical protein KIS62_00790 [Ramlibacter sp.]|nr:hypothetical protein [Ramlibacter sp.]